MGHGSSRIDDSGGHELTLVLISAGPPAIWGIPVSGVAGGAITVALSMSNVEQTPGSAIPEHGNMVGGEDSSGNFQPLQQDLNKNLEVTAANANWVNALTIPAGATYYITSGNELAVTALTINGTLVNYGILRCLSITWASTGVFIKGPNAFTELGVV